MTVPRTLLDVFERWLEAKPMPSLIDARGGADRVLAAAEVALRVAGLAQGLAALGIRKGDRVALVCNDRPEWHICDFGCLHLGAVNVPIYPTLLAEQAGVILRDSGARVVIAENAELLEKVLAVRASCPALEHVVLIEGEAPAGVRTFASCVTSLSGSDAAAFLAECRSKVEPNDLATLIYTSGTTGEPKGVMLTHDNFVFDAYYSAGVMPWPGDDLALAFLPLSHVLERLVDYIYFLIGMRIAYCGILETGEVFRRLKPTLFTAVPRFFEKVHDRVLQEVAHGPRLKQMLFHAALKVGVQSVREQRRGLRYRLFDALVYRKVRGGLGGRIRFCISGGAPLPVFIGEFFHAVGVRVLEGYGLTETSPVITVNTFARCKLGTVGPPFAGVEVKIASDGEILTRGRHVMRGYWNKPAETAAVLDKDGWLATGDMGELDSDNFLRVTDRKKDILVTAGGKNIAPQPIEDQLRHSTLVENAVLFGDRKPYVVAFLVPNLDQLQLLAKARGIAAADVDALLAHAQVVAAFQEIVDGVNHGLARFETIKKFRLIKGPFSIATGELTPTLKVKRRVVEKQYAPLLAAMYAEGGTQTAHEP
jgi:long-chain acyl-CoA synthetase